MEEAGSLGISDRCGVRLVGGTFSLSGTISEFGVFVPFSLGCIWVSFSSVRGRLLEALDGAFEDVSLFCDDFAL